jgi:hypothetical protein
VGRLQFITATRKRLLFAALLFVALPAVAAAAGHGALGIGLSRVATHKVASTTKLKVRPLKASQAQTVTFRATVKLGRRFAPAGTRVVFKVDGVRLGARAIKARGVATFSTRVATPTGSRIAGGRHVVIARYVGSRTVKGSHASKRLFVRCPGARGVCRALLADPKPAVGTAVYAGEPLTILAMSDQGFGLAGARGSAVLSTGRPLSVTTTATHGKPPHYVDSNHVPPRRPTHQLVLRFTLPAVLAPGSYAILIAAYEKDGASDQWYWPITVKPTPRAIPYTIAGNVATRLYPGNPPARINVNFTNPNAGNGGYGARGVRIESLTMTISAVSAPAATRLLPCSISDFAVTQLSGVYPFLIPHGTSSLKSLGFAEATWPSVRLVNRRVNQDGCRGATIKLSFAGAP